MTYLTTQFEPGCSRLVANFVHNVTVKVNIDVDTLGKRDEDTLLDSVHHQLSDTYVLRDLLVYRGGHHVAVCEGQRRLVLITAA